MLFQLDDFNISSTGFRVLYSIIRRAYHSKTIVTTKQSIQEWTKLSPYLVREALKELQKEKHIIVKSTDDGLRITLSPFIIEIIDKDFQRRGHKTKMSSPKSTQSPPKTGKNTKPGNNPKTPKPIPAEAKENQTTSTTKQKSSPHPQKPKTRKAVRAEPIKFKHEACTNKGNLYKYFEEWLYKYEGLSVGEVATVKEDEAKLTKYWKQYKEHAQTILKFQKMTGKKEADLNKIRFLQQIVLAS